MSTRLPTLRLLPLTVVLTVLAACGGGAASGDQGLATLEEPGQSTESATTTTTSPADFEEAALAFSQCMRDQGITDFPDPSFSDGGGGVLMGGPDGEGGGIDPESEEVQAAFEACDELLESAAFGRGGGEFDATELQDNLLEMAECLRDQGLEVDDPDLSNFGPVVGGPPPDGSEDELADEETGAGPEVRATSVFGDIDLENREVRAAMETCQEEVGFGPGQAGTDTEDDGQ